MAGPVSLVGFGSAVVVLVKVAEIDQNRGNIGVIGTERLFSDGEGAFVEWLRLSCPPQLGIDGSEIVEADGDVGIIGALCLFVNRNRALAIVAYPVATAILWASCVFRPASDPG